MRICPSCGRQYDDEMNYCLDDGTSLDPHAEKTIPFGFSGVRTNPDGGAPTVRQSDQATHVYPPAKKSAFGLIAVGIIGGALIFVGLIGYVVVRSLKNFKTVDDSATPPPTRTTRFGGTPIPKITPVVKTDQVKLEMLGNVKGGFDQTYIKCRLTNESDSVIKNPGVSLTLYKNDVKIGTTSGSSPLEYLKPGQSVPVWIDLSSKEEAYTAARPAEDREYTVYAGDSAQLFPNLIYSDAKLTSEAGSVLINFRSFKETYYEVKGTVENRDYDLFSGKIFLLLYDANSEIVGVTSTSPPELKRGEKAAFEASMSRRSLFGVPVRFELIAIDDSKKN